jgi:glycosyltransferase involved in cell wall biosynthesis
MDQPIALAADSSAAPRKINLLVLASSLWIGGAEVVIAHLARNLDRTRFNVIIGYLKTCGQIGDELKRDGVEVVSVAKVHQDRPNYFTFLDVLRLVRERQIDVIHTHTTHSLVDATLCKLFAPRVKVIHTFHFGNYPNVKPRVKWMEKVFSRGADRLYAVGKTQRDQLRDFYGFRESSIGTLWNGVNAPRFGDPAEFRAKYGIPEDTVLIGVIATLIKQKGLPDLMRVARRVLDSGRKARFIVCGEGIMREELEALRRELKLEDDVMLPGWVEKAAQLALPAFDVLYQPSLWEAMSVVLLEAMAAGKPLVATRVGEAPHFVEDGVDCLLVDPGDIEGQAAAVCRVIDDPALRARMGEVARRKWEQHFTVEHMTRAYEKVYADSLR